MSQPERRRLFRVVGIGILLLIAALALAPILFDLDARYWAHRIERLILDQGSFGVAVAIAIMVVHSFVPFPAELAAIVNGMVYGPVWGTLVTWSGAMIGAFVAFGLSRFLGRPFVRRFVAPHRWAELERWTAEGGWRILLVSRFIPLIAFNLINYAAGLSAVSWWTFGWTTAVGILPITILVVVLGHNIDRLTWELWLLPAAAGLLLFAIHRRKRRPVARPPDQSVDGSV